MRVFTVLIFNLQGPMLIALDFEILQSVHILAVMNLCFCCKKTDMSVAVMVYFAHQLKTKGLC